MKGLFSCEICSPLARGLRYAVRSITSCPPGGADSGSRHGSTPGPLGIIGTFDATTDVYRDRQLIGKRLTEAAARVGVALLALSAKAGAAALLAIRGEHIDLDQDADGQHVRGPVRFLPMLRRGTFTSRESWGPNQKLLEILPALIVLPADRDQKPREIPSNTGCPLTCALGLCRPEHRRFVSETSIAEQASPKPYRWSISANRTGGIERWPHTAGGDRQHVLPGAGRHKRNCALSRTPLALIFSDPITASAGTNCFAADVDGIETVALLYEKDTRTPEVTVRTRIRFKRSRLAPVWVDAMI